MKTENNNNKCLYSVEGGTKSKRAYTAPCSETVEMESQGLIAQSVQGSFMDDPDQEIQTVEPGGSFWEDSWGK